MIRRDGDILSGIELIRPTYTYYIHPTYKPQKYEIWDTKISKLGMVWVI